MGLLNPDNTITRTEVQKHKYAAFAFHSPNMMASHDWKLRRSGTVNNEEALAMLILSGSYIGFLPTHFTRQFTEQGLMRAVRPDIYHYRSDHAAIVRKIPRMPRRVEKFLNCLTEAHKV